MKKKNIKYFIFLISLFITNNLYANNIVYIDIDYILNNSIKGQSITKLLDKENKSIKEKFDKIEKQLKTEEKQIIAKKNILNDKDFKELINNFKIKVNDFNSKRKNSFSSLNTKKIDLTKDFVSQINPIFIEFAQKNSISIILKKKDIIIGDSKLDKTLEFLDLVNIKIKEKSNE